MLPVSQTMTKSRSVVKSRSRNANPEFPKRNGCRAKIDVPCRYGNSKLRDEPEQVVPAQETST
jgi:hypothetical protein